MCTSVPHTSENIVRSRTEPSSSAGSGNSRSSTGTRGAGITAARIGISRVEYLMPLFEYECRGCGRHFEYLTRNGQSPSCPACKSDDLQKLLSVFAVSGGSGEKSFPAPVRRLRSLRRSARSWILLDELTGWR